MSSSIRAEEIPEGGRKLVKIGDIEVGIFRIHDRFYAVQNECVHQSGPVCSGKISGVLCANVTANKVKTEWLKEGEILICPWHGVEYEIITGRCFAYKDRTLRTFPVRVEDGKVIVDLKRVPNFRERF